MHMQTNRCRVFARQIARDRTTRLNTRLIERSSRGVAVGQSLEAIHRLEPHLRAPVVRALQRLRHVERRSQPCRRRTADPSLDLNRREQIDWGWIKCEYSCCGRTGSTIPDAASFPRLSPSFQPIFCSSLCPLFDSAIGLR